MIAVVCRCWCLVFALVLLSACSDDDRRPCVAGSRAACVCADGDSGSRLCQADGTYNACSCGDVVPQRDSGSGRGPDASITFDSGSTGGETCSYDLRSGPFGGGCVARYERCSNSFTYAVVCEEGTCVCRENDLPGLSFPVTNYCGDITTEFQLGLTLMNCGWDWTLVP